MADQSDPYQSQASLITFGNRFEDITPHDSNAVDRKYKYFVVGATAGDVVCEDADGNESTFYVTAGGFLPCRPKVIKNTGTDATPIIGCWDE